MIAQQFDQFISLRDALVPTSDRVRPPSFGIENADVWNSEAEVRIVDHRIAAFLGIRVPEVQMMPRSEWLDWVAYMRVGQAKGWLKWQG